MDNQQPSFLKGELRDIILNAKFGDGSFWKHPECINYKIIFTSVTPELLDAKIPIAPELFRTGVRLIRKANATHCKPNAKPLYHLQSLVNEELTEAKFVSKEVLVPYLTLKDFGLWYLDDGGFIVRNDVKKYTPRFYLCLGDVCETEEKEEIFRNHIAKMFGHEYGIIRYNGKLKSDKNKIWYMPHSIGYAFVREAKKFLSEFHKYPQGKGSTTILQGSRRLGLRSSKRTPPKGDDIV